MSRNRSLPPLGPLRGFEAAARLGSFTHAAAELHLTQTAISHQIRALETQLGRPLFDRTGRHPTLTDQGDALQRLCTDYFDDLDTLCREIQGDNNAPSPLRVSLAPAFASRWLSPRLQRFWNNNVALDLIPSSAVVDFQREQIDLGIRCGDGRWPGLNAELLIPVRETPLCSPSLISGDLPLNKPDDLRHHTLLHERDHDSWAQWLSVHGVSGIDTHAGIICHDSIMLYDLIVAGQGVGLGSYSIIEKERDNGSLVAPFGSSIDPDYGYYLVYRDGALNDPRAAAFRDFLLRESASN